MQKNSKVQIESAQLAVEWVSRWMELGPGVVQRDDPYFVWATDKVEEITQDGMLAAKYITGFVHLCGQLIVDIASTEYEDYDNLSDEQKRDADRRVLQETILEMMKAFEE